VGAALVWFDQFGAAEALAGAGWDLVGADVAVFVAAGVGGDEVHGVVDLEGDGPEESELSGEAVVDVVEGSGFEGGAFGGRGGVGGASAVGAVGGCGPAAGGEDDAAADGSVAFVVEAVGELAEVAG
jgi:hypothetical protein